MQPYEGLCKCKLNEEHFVLGNYLDLQKALNTVNNKKLLHKLYNYGIRGVFHDWFKSYLSNRQQYRVEGSVSSLVKITCAVFNKDLSVLGFLIVLLFVNAIAN